MGIDFVTKPSSVTTMSIFRPQHSNMSPRVFKSVVYILSVVFFSENRCAPAARRSAWREAKSCGSSDPRRTGDTRRGDFSLAGRAHHPYPTGRCRRQRGRTSTAPRARPCTLPRPEMTSLSADGSGGVQSI